MRFSPSALLVALACLSHAAASPVLAEQRDESAALSKRALDPNDPKYSFEWREDRSKPARCAHFPPGEFKAFDFGDCTAQLSMLRDRRSVIYNWAFDAIYADGSRVEHEPIRDFGRLAVSDPDYTTSGGQNYRTTQVEGDYISVHEFTNVCRNGAAPVSWQFYIVKPSGIQCANNGQNWFKSRQIAVTRGVSRPAQARITAARRTNDAGDYELSWAAVSGAASYSVILQTYTGGAGETSYYTTIRGRRVQAPSTSVTVSTGTRQVGRSRFFVVNVVNAQGVWSFTPSVNNYEGKW